MTKRSTLLSGALLAALLLPAAASAGDLEIRDPSDMLTPQDEASLRDSARSWSFDSRVVVSSELPSRATFDRYVGQQVASPNMVVVGVDPQHRFTSVHFGTGTRIGRDRFSAIENAGDQWFRMGQWRGGIESILSNANASVGSAAAGEPTTRQAPGFPWGLALLGIGGVVVAVMVFRAMRNRQADGGGYADPYRGQPMGYGKPGGYAPGYGPNYGPNYGPGYGPQPGSGLGAGLVGAGLGGLAGYALGSAMSDHDGGGHHHNADTFGGGSDNGGSFDAGGSSSGWDGGGGGDFGGGGGDFGGGGGGDW